MTTDSLRPLNHYYATITWALLLILWGITILFDFIPIGVGLVGTGLVLLGLNAARSLKGIPTRANTTTLGILALLWGVLELARQFLPLPFVLSDWAIFASLLFGLGVIVLTRTLLQARKPALQ